jgi:hypothetical protein
VSLFCCCFWLTSIKQEHHNDIKDKGNLDSLVIMIAIQDEKETGM